MIAMILKDRNDECWLFGLFWPRYLTLAFFRPEGGERRIVIDWASGVEDGPAGV